MKRTPLIRKTPMKRSPLRQRTELARTSGIARGGPLKRSLLKRTAPLRQQSKAKNATKKRNAWATCSLYIRLRDGLRTTGSIHSAACCTCGKVYPTEGKGCIQAGHWIPGRHNSVLLDERGIHAQCMRCNVKLHGNPINYAEFMERTYGRAVMDELIAASRRIRQWQPGELEEIRNSYQQKIDELRSSNP